MCPSTLAAGVVVDGGGERTAVIARKEAWLFILTMGVGRVCLCPTRPCRLAGNWLSSPPEEGGQDHQETAEDGAEADPQCAVESQLVAV